MISWFFLEIRNWARLTSILKPRSSGCTRSKLSAEDEPRVEAREGAVRGAARRVPADVQRRAGRAAAARSRRVPENERLVSVSSRARQEAVGHLVAVAELHAAGQLRQPDAPRDVDLLLGDLRVDALDLHVQVLLEGDLRPPPRWSAGGSGRRPSAPGSGPPARPGVVAAPCPAGVGAGGTGCAATGAAPGAGAGWLWTGGACAGSGCGWAGWRRGGRGRHGLCGGGRPLSESGRGNRRHHERHERGSHDDIRPGVHLRQSPGNLFSRRGPMSARPVGAAQCKKQGVGDVAGTEQIDAPGRRTVRSSPATSGGRL